jgi:hypothetical protein
MKMIREIFKMLKRKKRKERTPSRASGTKATFLEQRLPSEVE